MATTQTPPGKKKVAVKEMSWDPITRIVGSLGIHTEIDFESKKVEKCLVDVDDLPRVRHLHEGDRPPRYALHHQPHLRHLRRQPLHDVVPEPEHGLRRQAAGAGGPRLQPRRGRGLHVRPRDLQRLHGERGLLRADGEGDEPVAAPEGGVDSGAGIRHPRLQDDRRHHARAEPVHGRLLSGDPPGGALHARDVLPVRRSPHAPLDDHAGRRHGRHHAPDMHGLLRAADALHRLRQALGADARRPLRLLPPGVAGVRHGRLPRHGPGLLGLLRRPRGRRLRLQDDDRLGAGPLRHARRRRSRASWSRPTWSRSTG